MLLSMWWTSTEENQLDCLETGMESGTMIWWTEQEGQLLPVIVGKHFMIICHLVSENNEWKSFIVYLIFINNLYYIGSVDPNAKGDPDMFNDTRLRGKRQSFTPAFADDFNYTTEERAVCGDDPGCLFDFRVTGSVEVAKENLATVENFTNITSQLSKFILCKLYNILSQGR